MPLSRHLGRIDARFIGRSDFMISFAFRQQLGVFIEAIVSGRTWRPEEIARSLDRLSAIAWAEAEVQPKQRATIEERYIDDGEMSDNYFG